MRKINKSMAQGENEISLQSDTDTAGEHLQTMKFNAIIQDSIEF